MPRKRTEKCLDGRRFVLLQGPSSRFFRHLGVALREQGADVVRVGFAPGDRLFWDQAAGRYVACKGEVPGALKEILNREAPTDLVMLGDGREAHAVAIAALADLRDPPTPWIVEHGYIRPNLIAVEAWGGGGRSRIPECYDPDAPLCDSLAPSPALSQSFLRYAMFDVAYNLTNLFLAPVFYPHYRTHAIDGPVREYAGWVRKGLTWLPRQFRRNRALTRINPLVDEVFLFPLQLETDFQIRHFGGGRTLAETCKAVIESFGRFAPEVARLVITVHPLDNGWQPWRRIVDDAAKSTGAAPRVVFLEGGTDPALIGQLAGVVTVNSTVGMTALEKGVPVKVLGKAIYDLPGLTDTVELDDFWHEPKRPDADGMCHFTAFLRAWFHVPGSFDGPGALIGAKALADRFAQPFPDGAVDK